jgi:hypothetical protein
VTRATERRLATLVGGGSSVRWELLEPGRRLLSDALELCDQLSQGLPDGHDGSCRYAAEQLREILRTLSGPAVIAATRRSRPRRDEQELPPGDRAARVA